MSRKKTNAQTAKKKETTKKAEDSAVLLQEEVKTEEKPAEEKKKQTKPKAKSSGKKKTTGKNVTLKKDEKPEKPAEQQTEEKTETKPAKKSTRKAPAKKKPAAKKAQTEKKQTKKKTRKPRKQKPEIIIEHYGPVAPEKRIFDKRFAAVLLLAIVFLWAVFPKGVSKTSYEKAELPQKIENPVAGLVINELVSGNTGVYCDRNNIVGDYVELYNGTDSDISLNGYGLSDTVGKVKWYFPDVTIGKGEYLVITLSGLSGGDLDASFRLSSDGDERLILYNGELKVIDSVDTVALKKNNALQRGDNGTWIVCDQPTPGYENSLEGMNRYYASLEAGDDGRLLISEFLPANKGNYHNENDDDEGFIELYNNSTSPILLSDYFLSGKPDEPFSYRLPEVQLQPQQYYVIPTGKKTVNLSKEYGCLILSSRGKILNKFEYEDLPNGLAIMNVENTVRRSAVVSPGYSNDIEGITAFQKENCVTSKGLIINEVMRNNYSHLEVDDKYYDWVEILNNSSDPIDLSSYRLADSINATDYFQLPDKLLEPGEYYIILCAGEQINTKYGNASFKISDNTSLYLLKGTEVADVIFVGKMPTGYSYGRGSEEGTFFFAKPTPASGNGNGYRAVSFTPEIIQKAGLYDGINELTVEIVGPGEIYYTLNGSVPDRNSRKYTGPITLTKTTALKAISYIDGMAASEISTSSYIINENHTLPVMSITLDASDFRAINTYYRASDYRKQAYVEYFDGEDGFESNCGLGLFGDESRSYAKKNYVMKFDKQFGSGNLHYQVFESRDNADYDSISIRAGGQDWRDSIIRDHLLTELVDENTDIVTYASKTIVVYINGQYWGLYTLREKKNASFFEDYFNASSEGMSITRSNGKIEMGDGKAYRELRYFVNTHNLNIEENYNYVAERLDLVQWADYWIAQTYLGNVDCDNIRYIQSPNFNGGKIMPIFYDLDWAMSTGYDYNYYMRFLFNGKFPCTWQDDYGTWHTGIENDIIRRLLKTTRFKQLWLERMKYHLENTWSTETVLAKIDKLVSEYETEIVRNQNRWGSSVSRWYSSISELRTFAKNRVYYLLRQTQNWLNISTTKMKEIFGDLYR
ncbi:MAG: lamin tail domain-containing protein [Erysipelotrichaceae bacterium]|nr:lamin tail domain-containing protein [Erysipelotrichaceae bacterium]